LKNYSYLFKLFRSLLYLFASAFVTSFILDGYGYLIEYFPKTERENASFARRFADCVDYAVESARSITLDEDHFRTHVAAALDALLTGNDLL
jgi:hypothetical protein